MEGFELTGNGTAAVIEYIVDEIVENFDELFVERAAVMEPEGVVFEVEVEVGGGLDVVNKGWLKYLDLCDLYMESNLH